MNWIDRNLVLKISLIYFKRILIPHTGDCTCTILNEEVQSWNFLEKLKSNTADNSNDICSGVSIICYRRNDSSSISRDMKGFHVR